MSESQLIVETAERIFADHCPPEVVQGAEEGRYPSALETTLVESGLNGIGLPDSGTAWPELFEVLRVAGRYAAPLPLYERLIAQALLGREAAGLGLGVWQDGRVSVAWPEQHEQVLLVDAAAERGAIVATGALDLQPGHSIAGEPLATGSAAAPDELAVTGVGDILALGRVAQMCGALERVLELAIGYTSEREQFGRTLSKFQAIQHSLAVLAAEVAAAQRATDAAIAGCDPLPRWTDVAVAKVRVGEAAGVCAESAHQAHGAMGFTQEHRLHHFTRRLWAWRDDAGAEGEWAARLGAEIVANGADNLWSFVTSHA
ncbi:MAG: acyl-CoA dehydrogenase family protein [Pseudomonadota bacterium]